MEDISKPSEGAEVSFETVRIIPEHARLIMNWRNDPTTLSMSYHRDPKTWDSFWPEFQASYFTAPDLPPLFAHVDGERVAFLRHQPCQDPRGYTGRAADVSINIAPAHRKKGLAARILVQAAEQLGQSAAVDTVIAEVREENEASHRTFLAAGYVETAKTQKLIEDTGETCAIRQYALDITGTYFRKGRVFVIAEAGSNWRSGTPARDNAMGRALIDVAVEAGADAVKFQTYRPETVYVANAGASDYLSDAGIKEDISDIFADLAMPYELVEALATYAKSKGILFMSTAFSPQDFEAVDPHVDVHKVASYEISHPDLIRLAAESGKPTIMSTGASVDADIAWAVDQFRRHGGKDLCVLQCTAKYPAPVSALNLKTIDYLARRFRVTAGLSDHSRDPIIGPVCAVARGARVVEKHYTLDNRLPGPDHAFAATPSELIAMTAAVRAAESSLGTGVKEVLPEEQELAGYARRGLQAIRDIEPGTPLVKDDTIAVLRPGQQRLGLHPKHLDRLAGKKATRKISLGDGVQEGDWQEDGDQQMGKSGTGGPAD